MLHMSSIYGTSWILFQLSIQDDMSTLWQYYKNVMFIFDLSSIPARMLLRNQLSMEQNIIIIIIIITIMHIDWIVSVIHYRLILNDRMIKMLWHRTRWSIALLLMIIQHLTCYIYGLSMLRDASWMLCWFTCSIFKTCETVVAISSLRKRTGQSKHYAQHQRHQKHHA